MLMSLNCSWHYLPDVYEEVERDGKTQRSPNRARLRESWAAAMVAAAEEDSGLITRKGTGTPTCHCYVVNTI